MAIARALLKEPSVLIFDEATSSLDAENEFQVQSAIERLLAQQQLQRRTKQQCLLVIGHRLSTVKDATSISVLQNGAVVEHGEWTFAFI